MDRHRCLPARGLQPVVRGLWGLPLLHWGHGQLLLALEPIHGFGLCCSHFAFGSRGMDEHHELTRPSSQVHRARYRETTYIASGATRKTEPNRMLSTTRRSPRRVWVRGQGRQATRSQ